MINRAERTLLYGSSLWYLGEGMFGPLFAVFATKIGGNVLDISWAWGVYLIVTGIFSLIVGELSGRISDEKLMVAGYVLNAFFTFAYLLVSTPLQLLLVQAGSGIATALSAPTWAALYAKHEDRKRAGFFWAVADSDFRIVSGIAILAGGFLVNYFSFKILFMVMGVVQLLAAVVQARILRK